MPYNEIFNICQPVIDWLKEQYPNNHKIVISTTGAELIECGKLIAFDKNLKETIPEQCRSLEKQSVGMQSLFDCVQKFNDEFSKKFNQNNFF